MPLAAVESSTASIWSAVFAGLAFVAAAVFGYLNLRRARKGPDGSVNWTVEAVGHTHGFYEVRQTGTVDALDVRVSLAPAPAHVDGVAEHDVVRPGQRIRLRILVTEEMEPPRITINWTPRGRRQSEESWSSDLPVTDR